MHYFTSLVITCVHQYICIYAWRTAKFRTHAARRTPGLPDLETDLDHEIFPLPLRWWNVWKGLNRYKNPEDIEYANISFLVSVLPSAPMNLRMITPWKPAARPEKWYLNSIPLPLNGWYLGQERGDTLEVYKSLQTHGAPVVSLLLKIRWIAGKTCPLHPHVVAALLHVHRAKA